MKQLTCQQVSVCVRYLCSKSLEAEVYETFLGFFSVAKTDAATLTSELVSFLKHCGLCMEKLVGKGFDGAANMCGRLSGVSTRLKQLYPNAKYLTHCRNHALNLA